MRSLSVFETFGVEPRFSHDLDLLESRFYALSRALHPDRFSQESPEIRQASLDRMGLINDAYRVLRDRALIREVLIREAGLTVDGQGSRSEIPMDLAESWFELQDLLTEDPRAALSALDDFTRELKSRREAGGKILKALEDDYDAAPSIQKLEQIAKQSRASAYLDSLERDLKRLHLAGRHGS